MWTLTETQTYTLFSVSKRKSFNISFLIATGSWAMKILKFFDCWSLFIGLYHYMCPEKELNRIRLEFNFSGDRKKDYIFVFRLKLSSLINTFEVCSYQYKVDVFVYHLKKDSWSGYIKEQRYTKNLSERAFLDTR